MPPLHAHLFGSRSRRVRQTPILAIFDSPTDAWIPWMLMSSTTDKIVDLFVTTCVCPGRDGTTVISTPYACDASCLITAR
ncbi:hypothetical protein CEXT_485121 [Caerostris extrusa]|uniref:Uncharacterized protein n=1 Tax=Caerostris extrusa TaxID=172846 RepID=A0AAV4Q848_CAEEX|nr:hypothetical protein CEXT_485121 [Caerostris extrusa]